MRAAYCRPPPLREAVHRRRPHRERCWGVYECCRVLCRWPVCLPQPAVHVTPPCEATALVHWPLQCSTHAQLCCTAPDSPSPQTNRVLLHRIGFTAKTRYHVNSLTLVQLCLNNSFFRCSVQPWCKQCYPEAGGEHAERPAPAPQHWLAAPGNRRSPFHGQRFQCGRQRQENLLPIPSQQVCVEGIFEGFPVE